MSTLISVSILLPDGTRDLSLNRYLPSADRVAYVARAGGTINVSVQQLDDDQAADAAHEPTS